MTKIKIRKYTTVDVYYSDKDVLEYEKIKKKLIRSGYELNMKDTGAIHDYCDQYIKYLKK